MCTGGHPRNQRTRPSALFEVGDRAFLVDTSPELRIQTLRAGLRRVDAVLFTHYHADHIFGIDDLKSFNVAIGATLPCYGNEETEHFLRSYLGYVFAGTPYWGGIPHISFESVSESFDLQGAEVTPVELQHGRIGCTGWRIGDVAYLTDCNRIPPASMELLHGLDVLVIDALRPRPHPTHFSIDEAIAVTRPLRPARTVLTHLTHEVDYPAVSASLPPGVELAYDGLVLQSR